MGSLPELRRVGAPTPSPPPPSATNGTGAGSRQPYSGPRYSVGATTNMQIRSGATRASSSNAETNVTAHSVVSGRRRESCASSLGAASVRRLVRPIGSGEDGAGPTRRDVTARTATLVYLTRAFAAAALLPLQVLQGAHGLWAPGAPLLVALHASSAFASYFAPAIIHVVTVRRMMPAALLFLSAFFLFHLWPKVYVLAPLYLAAGACWGPLALAHKYLLASLCDWSCAVRATTSSGVAASTGSAGASGAPLPAPQRRATLRKLARCSRAARDLGLFVAAILLPLLPTLHSRGLDATGLKGGANATLLSPPAVSSSSSESRSTTTTSAWSLDDADEELELWRESRCGARACPGVDEPPPPVRDADIPSLTVAMATCCATAALASLAALCSRSARHLCPMGATPWRASTRALGDARLRFVAPLALFIGLEQGFLYAHLMQWYVVCVSEAGQPWRALVGVAVLRAVVACTLSMLLAHGRRRLVVVVGLMWHACLLLALSVWRAARADLQLPPVMAAAWAGCDAVWELVQATFLEDPWSGGLAALAQCFCSLGLALSLLLRWLFCAPWTLRTLMLALPIAGVPILFTADR